MRYRFILGMLLLMGALPSFAQDVRTQMNQIKMDESYIKVEVNDESKEEAFELAVMELLDMIADEVKNKEGVEPITRESLLPHLKSLDMPRGDIYRVLVYAKRAKVFGEEEEESEAEKLSKAMQEAGILQEEQSQEEDAGLSIAAAEVLANIGVGEAPQEEKPAEVAVVEVQEHAAEVAAVEVNEKTEQAEETSALDEQNNMTEQSQEEKVENVAETEVIPVEMETNAPATPKEELVKEELQTVIESLMEMETARDVLDALKQFQNAGQITEYGGLRQVKTMVSKMYVVVFEKEKRTMVAFLTPENNGKRVNLLTQKEDDLENYKGATAILFE